MPAVDKSLNALLHAFEIIDATHGRIAHIIRQGGGFLGIGLQGTDNVHPVQGMQMIKMNNVIMLELGAHEQIANDARIVGYLDADCIIDCPHRGQSMGVSSDAAGALHKMMGIPWISALQDDLDTPEHLA